MTPDLAAHVAAGRAYIERNRADRRAMPPDPTVALLNRVTRDRDDMKRELTMARLRVLKLEREVRRLIRVAHEALRLSDVADPMGGTP